MLMKQESLSKKHETQATPRMESFRASPTIKILASDSKPHSRLSTLEKNSPAFLTTKAGQDKEVNMFDLQNIAINKTTDWNNLKQRHSMLLNSSDHTQTNMLIVDRDSRAGSRGSYNHIITTPEKKQDPNSITIQPFNKI
jgi:hypothetical protein